MYKNEALKEYISKSELRVFSDRIRVRLSKELAEKYDNGSYTNYLTNMQKYINMIDTLDIQYPDSKQPVLYIYIFPDNNYAELLNIPKIFDRGRGGGKPVRCYDADGYNNAYGLTQNILEKCPEEINISLMENNIHELAHMVHSQFFLANQAICEGFAETLPLYALNIEEIFDEHRNTLIGLDKSQIFTAKELFDSEKNGTFGAEAVLPNKSCSFRFSYISSYLLVRGCVESIVEKNGCTKAHAIQSFLEIVKNSNCFDESLISYIANAIGVPQEVLLNGKELQMKVLESLSTLGQNQKISK